jgi:PAS domain S-box-containing protein
VSRRLRGYGVVVAGFAAASANLLWMRTPGPVPTFLVVVALGAWVGGRRPGLLAIVLSLGAMEYFRRVPSLGVTVDFPRLAFFTAISAFVVWLVSRQREASRSLDRAHDELRLRNEALQSENQAAKTLEDLLRQGEERLRLVIDTIPTMAWIVLPDGRLEFLNRRWLDYTGLSLEDGLRLGNATLHPEDIAIASEKRHEAMAEAKPFEHEMRLRRADGEYRWFLVRTVPLLDADGRVLRWYGTSTDIEDRKHAEHALRELSRRLVELQEAERKQLSRELHDRVGQSLTALKLNVDMLEVTLAFSGNREAVARLADSAALLSSTMDTIENVMSELRPPMLDIHGIAAALEWHARNFSQRTGIAVAVRAEDLVERPLPQAEIALFRIAQEALNNVAKHAGARAVHITLEDGDGEWLMAIEDDGVGFDAAGYAANRSNPRLGIVTMRERSQAVGGRFEVRALAGGGTRLTVRVPWDAAVGKTDRPARVFPDGT